MTNIRYGRDLWAAGLPSTKALYTAIVHLACLWCNQICTYIYYPYFACWFGSSKDLRVNNKSALHWCPLDVSGVHFGVVWNFVVYTLKRVPLSTWVGQRRNHLIRYAIETDEYTDWSGQWHIHFTSVCCWYCMYVTHILCILYMYSVTQSAYLY